MIAVNAAIGGSTNAPLYIMSIARELGIEMHLGLSDDICRLTPALAENPHPSTELLIRTK